MSGNSSHEWRQVSDYEWWLVFKDAPVDFGRNGPVGYPPSMTVTWVGCGACCHLHKYYNGAWPDDDSEDSDYLHLCDPRDLIAELQAWVEAAKYPGKEQI